jgi:hypothetical protein
VAAFGMAGTDDFRAALEAALAGRATIPVRGTDRESLAQNLLRAVSR